MKHVSNFKLLSLVLALVLIAAAALSGCSAPAETTGPATEMHFTCIVTDPEDKETTFEITTTAPTVGEALEHEGLLAGEEGPYGLYIKTVNGVTLDYETHGMYWSFYIGDEYALTGVDETPITEGAVYRLKAEAA